jgi:CheY-like chemotaxis protein
MNEQEESLSTKGITYVLVAEDVEINYTLIQILLSQINIKSLWAVNGEEAVKLCKNHPEIRLVLMDIRMPVMDGYEATRLIKEYNKNIPIIAQTAYVSQEDQEKCREAGCDDFIPKPIYLDKLKEVLSRYI